jgi:hypothetical protein
MKKQFDVAQQKLPMSYPIFQMIVNAKKVAVDWLPKKRFRISDGTQRSDCSAYGWRPDEQCEVAQLPPE